VRVDPEPEQAAAAVAPLNLRQRRLWAMHDFAEGRGLEIGPLHKTSVPRGRADVRYLDVFDRDTLLANYRDDPMVPTDLIPEIDYALLADGRVRSIPEAIGDDEPFDWVVASHVIEHVPDVVGWLDQIARITADGGALVLIVPDRRYCFDVHRPSTTVGQMLQAHEQGDVTPSVRAVYDHFRSHVFTDTGRTWAGHPPDYAQRSRSLETVLDHLEQARRGEYVDAHVWTFTPDTLVEQLVELRSLGLSAWTVDRIRRTRRNELEFYVVLRRLPRDPAAPSPWLEAEVPRRTDMPDWLAETVRLRRRVERLEQRLARRKRVIRRQRRALARLRRRAAVPPRPSLPRRAARRLRRLSRG
jgi:SAM-dependent methyltransferase